MATIGVAAGDVVAVRLPPGEPWGDIVATLWTSGATVLPIDHRLPSTQVAELLARARPTVVGDEDGWRRVAGGDRAGPDLAVIVATSGSAAGARLVELTRGAVAAAVLASASALGAEPADGWVSALPPAHIGGLLVVLRSVLLGASLSFASAADPASLAPPPGARCTSLVPTLLQRALDAGVDLTGYRAILIGGAAFPGALAARAAAAGVRCVATYGLTESCGGVVYDGVALPGVRVRIGAGAAIELHSPTLLRGYRDAPSNPPVRDGWLRTGDAGTIDGDGRLHVAGRLDDVIVTGGENVWPTDVETALLEDPEVAEVAVTGAPDATWGSRVVAVVVPRDRRAPPVLDDLRDRVAARLGRHQAPRALVLVDALPRTALGKVARAELRRLPVGGGDAG
jgi:O-succinylbenzoic acid--CoA ligase